MEEQEKLTIKSLIEYHTLMSRDDIKMYYKGPFDEVILSKMIAHVRGHFSNPKVSHKIFSIFMELAQNISFYSSEKPILEDVPEIGVGTVIIQEKTENYTLVASNLVETEKIDSLIDRLEEIKSLDFDGLRQLKKRLRSMPVEEGKDRKTGNIGLVQAAIKADHPLSFDANKIDDENSLLTIFATVNKQ